MIYLIKRLIMLWLLFFTFLTEAKADINCPGSSGSDTVNGTMPALDVSFDSCSYHISGFSANQYNDPGAQPASSFPFTGFLPDGLTLSSPPNPARFVMHTGSAVAIFSSASCSGATISGLNTNALDVALSDGASCILTFGADSDNQGFSGATLSRSGLVYSITAGTLSGGPYGGTYTAPVTTKAEPTNHPTAFTATANSISQITTAWTDATGAVTPDSYLLMCSTSSSFTDPVDTTAQTDDTDCADGAGVQNITQGTGTVAWTGLTAGTQYYYKIFPYSNTGADIDYKTDATVGTANATTTAVNTIPTITGTTANQAVNDNATLTPFLDVVLADTEGNNISISITLDDNTKGSLSTTSIASGSIASVQTALRAIVFTPTANRVAVGSTETTTFSITANDGTSDSAVNSVTTVVSTSVNDAPTDITLTGTTVAQSAGANGVIATLGSSDADTGDGATYSLVTGTGDTNNGSFNIDGTNLRATDAGTLAAGTYSILLQVNDGDDSYTEVVSITVTDDVAPTLTTLSPVDNATAIATNSNLVITLNENAVVGTGNILIKKNNDDSIVQAIDVTSGLVTIANAVVTINPSVTLDLNTEYSVQIPATALKDSANNAYAGIQDTTSWSFTTVANTAPTITGTTANQAVNDNATLTPFLDVVLADTEGNDISISITLDDNTKGSLSTTSIASGSIASVQTALRAIVFTPTANRVAVGSTETTTFSITANDGTSDSAVNSVTTVVSTSVNDAPTITIDSILTTNEDDGKTLSFTYTDIDGDTVTATQKTAPTHGTIEISGTTITYTPTANYNGTDTFVITLTDSAGYTTDKTITVTVSSINDEPSITIDSTLTTDEDNGKTLSFTYTDIDGDSVTATQKTAPSHGTIEISGTTITYTPTANYNGTDT
ncbi:MAG: Flagellar hook-length control protein FliK, partial [uncultured Sulfurovum sp.]